MKLCSQANTVQAMWDGIEDLTLEQVRRTWSEARTVLNGLQAGYDSKQFETHEESDCNIRDEALISNAIAALLVDQCSEQFPAHETYVPTKCLKERDGDQ